MFKSCARWPVVLAAVPLLTGFGVAAATSAASASATDPAAHTRSGPVINMLVVGDSYVAGNGASGATYNVSPDDVSTPPKPYSGTGCYRRYQNASMIAYNNIGAPKANLSVKTKVGSAGFYINRACSGKTTSDVLPEVSDLAGQGSDIAGDVDLVVYSSGGNDVDFQDIALQCILLGDARYDKLFNKFDPAVTTVGGKKVNKKCVALLASLNNNISGVIAKERTNLVDLLNGNGGNFEGFPNADIVVDGYPMLVNKVKGTSQDDNTVNYAYAQLSTMMPKIETQQAAMVKQLDQQYDGRVAFNDVFSLFGKVAGNHGVNSAKPWLWGALPTRVQESLHPNPTGQQEIATGIVQKVQAAGWFNGYPTQPAAPVKTFNYITGSANLSDALLADSSGNVYTTTAAVSQLRACPPTVTLKNVWVSANQLNVLDPVDGGPDTAKVSCSYPAAGDIVEQGSALYLVTSASSISPASFKLESIPGANIYNCEPAAGGRYFGISKTLLSAHKVTGSATCPAT